jgi:hypothetical protein
MNWITLAQDTDRWRALAIAALNLLVPHSGELLTSGGHVRKGLTSLKSISLLI